MKLSHAQPETVNREAELQAPMGVGSGALLGHPLGALVKLVQAGNKCLVCFFIFGVSCFLPILVCASPCIKPDSFIGCYRVIKSSPQPLCDTMSNFQNLGFQFWNLSMLWTEQKFSVTLGGDSPPQTIQKTPESPSLPGGIKRISQPITEEQQEQGSNGSESKFSDQIHNALNGWLGSLVSGMAGAITYAIFSNSWRWWRRWPNVRGERRE
jgi:hypothetical protein